MSKQAFQDIKLNKKVEALNNTYEIYDGFHQISKQPVVVIALINADQQTVDKILQMECQSFEKPTENYLLNTDYYVAFQKQDQWQSLTEFAANKQLTEQTIWAILRQLMYTMISFKKNKLVVNSYDPDYVFIKDEQIKFASIHCVVEQGDTTKLQLLNTQHQNYSVENCYQQEVYNIACLVLQLLDPSVRKGAVKHSPAIQNSEAAIMKFKFSDCLNYLLQSMLHANYRYRPTPEQLYDHHFLFSYDMKNNSILNHTKKLSIQDFKVIKQLGEGTYGACDLAIFLPSGEQVVLKQSLQKQTTDVETNIMRDIGHPSIVSLLGSFSEGRVYYIVIQFCEQGDLFNYLTSGKPPRSEEQVFKWFSQLASALYYMHNMNYIHRDIKPQNILLSQGKLLFTDFGVSRKIEIAANTMVGTPLYFSPEQFFQQPYDSAADIFSFGLVFINIILGSHPFVGEQAEIAKFFNSVKEEKNCDKYCDLIDSDDLRNILSKMLQFDPKKRITAGQICQQPCIMKYLIQQDLVGPSNVPFYSSTKAQVKLQHPLTEAFTLARQCREASLRKFALMKKQLGTYYDLATALIPFYTYQLYLIICPDKSTYSQYVCYQICKNDISSKVELFNIDQKDVEIRDKVITVRVCTLMTDFASARKNLIFVTPALIFKQTNIEIEELTIATSNIIVENDTPIQLKCKKAQLLFKSSFGSKITINNKKGALEFFGPKVQNIQQEAKSKSWLTQKDFNDLPLKCFLKLIFYSFAEKFKKNAFDYEENQWFNDEILPEDEEMDESD